MRVLLLCNYDVFQASTVCSHINSFHKYSEHDVFIFTHIVSNNGNIPESFPLEDFDAVVLHYSIFLSYDNYVSPKTRERIRLYSGIKCIFLQDEYRLVNKFVKLIRKLEFDAIFTCVPKESIDLVYTQNMLPDVLKINVLTGYIPEELVSYKVKPLNQRKYDVSYRGRKYPAWHGELGQEKWRIGVKFKENAKYSFLRTNIKYGENDRLYGMDWVSLLTNSKGVLGVESGSSVFDFDGVISSKVETIQELMPDFSYEKLRLKTFMSIEGKIPLAQISPRIFEAIALRTVCVLYEGEYSGILIPWRHYIPLKKDHSNIKEVISTLKNNEVVSDIISNAYSEIAVNEDYSYKSFIQVFDETLNTLAQKKGLVNSPKGLLRDYKYLYKEHPFYFFNAPYLFITGKKMNYMISFFKKMLPKNLMMNLINRIK